MRRQASTAAQARARISVRLWLATYRGYRTVYHPFVDLGIRLAIAQAFFRSGLVKAMDWPTALALAANEYPVRWLSADHAAGIGLAIELVCPVLLALGLFTRAAALPMGLLALVIQSNYLVLDTNLIWAAILFGYVVFGACALSLDALIAPGLRDSALPLGSRAARLTARFEHHAGPWFQLALRLWLGWALLQLPAPAALFPVATVHAQLPGVAAFIGGAMFVAGAGTSFANKGLAAVMVGSGMIMNGDPGSLWLIALLAQVGMTGAGSWSLDAPLSRRLSAWLEPRRGVGGGDDWPRVVIVGAGFGGMACAARLRYLPVHLTIVDRNNYMLFQPLLYQVATAGLSPADIAAPVRSQFRDDPDVRVIMRAVTGIDPARRRVLMDDRQLPYDFLVVATGASHSYFGHDDWRPFAPGLKGIDDATAIRAKLLHAFERAEQATCDVDRAALLTFVIVGGGPTGVELAGALAELARFGLQQEFRGIDPAAARIVLVQSGPRILPAFPQSLAAHAHRSLERLGVDVRTDSRVDAIDARGVSIHGTLLVAGTILWAAGVVASPAAEWLGVTPDQAGRVPVDDRLRVPGYPNIFVIGDTAAMLGRDGQPVPGLAPAAKQGGLYAAAMIRARLEQRDDPPPFHYRHQGSLATIGRKEAVADFGRVRLWGTPAWWLWGMVHVLFLAGVRNRIAVVTAWAWAYLTYRNGSRLITGQDAPVKN